MRERLPNQEAWLPSMTKRARIRLRARIYAVKAALRDAEKKRRHAHANCQWCWYFCRGRTAGQAFTRYTCRLCDAEGIHPNTGVPLICSACAEKYKLCVECGADIDLRAYRKLDPLKPKKAG